MERTTMDDSLERRAQAFRALHARTGAFPIPNPWDAGSARILQHLGFEALATTSLGVAIGQGRERVGRAALLANCREICEAVTLPVHADLEDGFGPRPEDVAASVIEASACGAVGASIEDATQDPDRPLYDFGEAVERVAAAVEAAHGLPVPMSLTARAENHLCGVDDLDDTIRRLQAFERVGADVLYAPGLRSLNQMERVVSSVSKPVNVVMGFADPGITLDQLSAIGVKRVSIGGALLRLAYRRFLEGAREMQAGNFGFVREIVPLAELTEAFRGSVRTEGIEGRIATRA